VTALTVGSPTVAAQAAGGRTLALRPAAAGTLRAWGSDQDGQLGNGKSGGDRTLPVTVKLPSGVRVTSVRAGCNHSVALTSTGRVLAWGLNSSGQLGDGKTRNSDVPVQTKVPAGVKVRAVRVGGNHSLLLSKSGKVLAWGLNHFGELGDGTTRNRRSPVRVKLPSGTRIKAISAGCDFNLALTTGGHVLAWGFNEEGELGDGAASDRHRPVRVKLPRGIKVTSIAAGCGHSLAVTSTGKIYGWGLNDSGQVGDGTFGNTRLTPVKVKFTLPRPPTGHITGLFAGCAHSLALYSGGAILAWGSGSDGQLGNNTNDNSDSPIRVILPTGVHVKAITAGCDNGFALTAGGNVLAWGAR
jgi:alpha-tubulin suppressor-like RCC1 family protein